ncbi:MAG: hypothetical protein ACKO96_15440, partial [Flammeovirgaceae bacterium]
YDNILSTASEFIKNRPYQQHLVFNSYSEKVNTFNVPILHLQQSQFFYGKLILFDIPSVILTNKFPNISQRILFTSDAHWTQSQSTMYQQWKSVYDQNNLDIIVTSPVLNDLYSMCWKKPMATVERFSYDELSK